MQTGRPNKQSFTLIEMLVVMVIIVVLAGLLLPVVQVAKTSADQARARENIHQMAAAFRAYFSEFGRWPSNTFAAANIAGAPSGSSDYLITTNLFANTSSITFYDYSAKDIVQVVSGTITNAYIVDPWKNPYRVRLDTGYTGGVLNPHDNSTLLQWGFAIWSQGPDGTNDLGGDTSLFNKDNLKSW